MLETLVIPFSYWLLDKVGENAISKIAGSIQINAIDTKFKKAIKATSKQLQKKYPDVLGGSIEEFFGGGDIYNVVYRLLFRDAKVDIDVIKGLLDNSTLPETFVLEFISLLKLHCLKDRDLNEILTNNNLYISVLGISEDANKIVQLSSLSFNEVRLIRELLVKNFDEQFSIKEFIPKYSKSAIKVLSELNFLGLGVKSHIKKNRKKLTDVYVEPTFSAIDGSLETTTYDPFAPSSPPIFLKDIFRSTHNIVILGNPGSGKSVLVRHLICSILEKTCQQIVDSDVNERLPFRIELRKYFQFKKNTNEGIVKYFIKSLENDYGLINITEKNIETLLNECKILVFFDGLDEIFNATDKVEITKDIEVLLDSYKNITAVVTSRVIGYEEAKLSNELFGEIKILNFNDKQIEEYTNRWYFQEEADLEIRSKEINEFLRLHKKVDEELIRNPLLLSLIIILFRNNLKLPESKLEIYQSCTKTLVDKWDLTKELKIELPEEISKKKETLFADLAFWQYERLSSENVKITNVLATAKIADSIINKLKVTDDYISAEALAEQFLNYALKRSLYFDNNFTHKTFLEYFTAYWIFSNIEKKHKTDERNEIIAKYIDVAFWSIVLELLINMIDQDQADTEIIDNLFNYQILAKPTGLPFLLEITSFLKNISATTVANLVDATVNYLITEPIKKQRKHSIEQRHFQSLINFINNNETQLGIFKSIFLKYSKNLSGKPSLKSLILLYLELCFHHRNDSLFFDEGDFHHLEKVNQVIKGDAQLFFFYTVTNKNISLNFVDRVLYALENFPNDVLRSFHSYYDSYYFPGGFFGRYLYWELKLNNMKSFESNMDFFFKKGLKKNILFDFIKEEKYFGFSNDITVNVDFVNSINSKSTDPMSKLVLLSNLWTSINSPFVNSNKHSSTQILPFELQELLVIPQYGDFFKALTQHLNLHIYDTQPNKLSM